MLIENFNERIQPHLAEHPLRPGASMDSDQKENGQPTDFYRRA
jgi:hypothetical protein